VNRHALCLVVLTGALVTSCGGSSGKDEAAPPASSPAVTSASPDTPEADPVPASPAPAGFPAGTYTRTVKFTGRLDGVWTLKLNADGSYVIARTSGGDILNGTYSVPATGRLIAHGEVCSATYTYKTTSGGLALTDTGGCADEDLHDLLNAEWLKA
jgi:hypothetical protein